VHKLGGVVISQDTVESDVSALDALKRYASKQGRQIEYENLEYYQDPDKKYWEMYETDGTRIVVEEV
jgi:hypothetical protein